MRRRRGEIGQMGWSCCVYLLVVVMGLVFVGATGAVGVAADSCPNKALRVGPSTGLPDCRAYELVTPADLGRTQALTFTNGGEQAIASGDGESLALQAVVPFGPNPSENGVRAVFSRTAAAWEMGSAVAPGASDTRFTMQLFSPNLSQVLLQSQTGLNEGEPSPDIVFEAGPVGGPYALVASIPRKEALTKTEFRGASADFSDVLFASTYHELPLSSVEATASEATDSGAPNLYDWSGGHLRLVNATQDGSSLANPCGATLGAVRSLANVDTAVHAVSEDGSTVFFTSPAPQGASGPGCQDPGQLFMRVNSGEPVDVSVPEEGVEPSASLPVRSVRYNYATPDGSKVFFNTETVLTRETVEEEEKEEVEEKEKGHRRNKLFEYDTEAPEGSRLKLIASGVPATYGDGVENLEGFWFSEDGSVVYVEYGGSGETQEIYRYDTSTGKQTFVARAYNPHGTSDPPYSTSNGEFFLFASKSLVEPREPRGAGPQNEGKGPDEMYRYDNANGSVICVTCGAGDAPAQGEVVVSFGGVVRTSDDTPPMTLMSEDGQEVFFQTTAQLVPQDTNSTTIDESSVGGLPGLDVYEWEAEGNEEAPGVFCRSVDGCTHLLSSGEDVGPARLLGASADGRDVFFETAAQLVPQATEEFPNLYDARVDGGFASPSPVLECLSCQGVGSPPPLFSVPASESFAGTGNPGAPVVMTKLKKKKSKPKRKHGTRHKGESKTLRDSGSGRPSRASKEGKRS